MRGMWVMVLLAAALAVRGEELDYAPYVRSEAIVRGRIVVLPQARVSSEDNAVSTLAVVSPDGAPTESIVLSVDETSGVSVVATIEVDAVYWGRVRRGRLLVRLDWGLDELGQEEMIFFLRRVNGAQELEIFDARRTNDELDRLVRRAVSSIPRWAYRGPVSVVSYPLEQEITLDPHVTLPMITIWIGYRNETEDVIKFPEGIFLHPHDVLLRQVTLHTKAPVGREEREIAYNDGTYAFDPIRITVVASR